ncbi:hypothetical protein, partial [Limnospira sp. PMC 1261.20]|uniref:hypothetical protein n=5 Tax=unclassified Limnospira TaxID=2642885 RepID=UPI0028E34931
MTEVNFALGLFTEVSGTRQWISAQADLREAAFVGIPDFTLTVQTLELAINRAASDGSLIDFAASPVTVVSGPGLTRQLNLSGETGEQTALRGDLEIAVADVVTLQGTFAFRSTELNGTRTLVAIGDDIQGSLQVGAVQASVTGASFGLLANSEGDLAFETRGGAFSLSADGFAAISAESANFRYTNAQTTLAADTEFEVLWLSFAFSTALQPGTLALDVTGFQAELDEILGISGDLSFFRQTDADGEVLLASGQNLTLSLTLADLSVVVANASFALALFDRESVQTRALFATGEASLNGLPGVSFSGTLSVWINNTGDQMVDFGGAIGEIDFGTDEDFFAFRGENLQLTLDDFVTVSGTLTLVRTPDSLLVTGTDVEASLGLGDIRLSVTDAQFAFAAFADESFALTASGTASLTGVPGLTLSGTLSALLNNTGSQEVIFGDFGAVDFGTVDPLAIFEGQNLQLAIDDFVTVSGYFRFEAQTDFLLATATDVQASLSLGDAEISVSDAAFALRIQQDERFALHAAGTAALSGISALSLSGNLEIWVNTTGTSEVDFGDYGVIDFQTTEELFAFRGTALQLAIADLATLEADLTVVSTPGSLLVTGENVRSSLSAGSASLTLDDGTLRLAIFGNGQYALSAAGTAALTGVPGLTLSGSIAVQANTTGVAEVTFGDAGTVDFGTSENLLAFRGSNLIFAIDGFASLTGTFTFVSEAGLISVSGTDVSASLGLGGTAVTVSNALFGLNLLADGTYALYAEGTAALTGIPALTLSGDLAVRANTTGLQTASFSDFADPVDFGTPDPFFAFRGTGLSLAIDGFVTLSGDFTFVSVPDSLSVTGLNVSASLSAGTVSASVTEATLGMALFADGTYALYAAGTAALSGIPALTLSG